MEREDHREGMTFASAEEIERMWTEIPRDDARTAQVLQPNRRKFPVPRSFRVADAGFLAPDGEPVLAYRYQTEGEPWTGIGRIPLDRELRFAAGAPRIMAVGMREIMRASVRLGSSGSSLCVACGLPFAMWVRGHTGRPAWSFMPFQPDIVDEIPASYKTVDIYVPAGPLVQAAEALLRRLQKRGQSSNVYEIGTGSVAGLN